MTRLFFDTFEAAKKFESAGFNPVQTEVLVKTMHDAVNDNVATRADLKELGAKLKTALDALRAETKADIKELRADMNLLRWMVGFNLALTAAGVLALIFR